MKQLNVNFPKNITKFESIMKKRFLIKTIFYKKIFRGKGFEFDGYREYADGDDASLIDWKATVKSKKLLVKQYIEEQDLKIFFIIDIGDNMALGSGEHLKNEIAAEIAACLAHLVIVSGDSMGFSLYNEKIVKNQGFSAGVQQFYYLEKHLKDPNIYRGKSDLKKALKVLLPFLKKSSAVFIISDFIRLDDGDLKILREFMRRYETIGIMVRDPVDTELPDLKREVVVEDIYTGQQLLINPGLIKYEYGKNAFEQKRKIENVFKKEGSDLLCISTDKDFINPLVEFLKSRVKLGRYVMPQR